MANINRFKAFEKVGKSINADVDFDKAIGVPPDRSSNSITEASRELTLPIDQLKNALFWLVSTCPAEDIAMKNLNAGNIEKALSIVGKFATWSATLNYHTMSMMNGDLKGASIAITRIIALYKNQLFDGLSLDTLNLSDFEFANVYYDLISNDFSSTEIINAFKSQDAESANIYEVILNRVCTDYVTKIDRLISTARDTPKTEPESNRIAAFTLQRKSESVLSEFKSIAEDSPSYAIIADKLALQALQNGINYYNNTKDGDAARRIIPVFEFAKRTAVGQLAKDRCNENYSILKEAYDELPPLEAVDDIKSIENILSHFSSGTASALLSKELVLECAPSLGNLKEKCGLSHPAVIRISTLIVRKALNSIIANVNAALDRVKNSAPFSRNAEQAKAKKILADAWDATLHLDRLPLSEDAKGWYTDNCKRLKEILTDAGIPILHTVSFRIMTEPEYFQSCKTKIEYQKYLKLYPNARYREIAKKRIAEFEKQEEFESKRQEELERILREERKQLLEIIEAISDLSRLWTILPLCKDASTISALDEKVWFLCKRRSDYREYLLHLPNGKHKSEAENKSKHILLRIIGFFKRHQIWPILIGSVLAVLLIVWLIGGLGGIQICLCVIGAILAMVALGAINERDTIDNFGCAVFLIGGALAILCFVGAYLMDDAAQSNETFDAVQSNEENQEERELADTEEEVYNLFMDDPTEYNLKKYLQRYRDGKHIDDVVTTYISKISAEGPIALDKFWVEYTSTAIEYGVPEIINNQCDSLYEIASKINTSNAWIRYQRSVPSDQFRDSQEKLEELVGIDQQNY